MSFNSEDPKWTAYVLDELDTAERAKIEQELAASAEARQFIEELRSTMRLLSAELKSEPALALSAAQRAAIHEQAQPQVTLPEQRSFARRHWAEASVVAATVLLLAGFLVPAMQRARESASRARTDNNAKPTTAAAEARASESSRQSDFGDHSLLSDLQRSDAAADQPVPSTKPPQEGDKLGTLTLNGGTNSYSDYTVSKPVYATKSKPDLSKPGEDPAFVGGATAHSSSNTSGGQKTNLRGYYKTHSDPRLPSVEVGARSGLGTSPVPVDTPLNARPQTVVTAGPLSWDGAHEIQNQQSAERPVKGLEWQYNAEAYDQITGNPFHPAKQNPLSTFSIDVDTASYSNIRRFLTQNGVVPPPGAVRIEEMINYFRYDYPQPEGDVPFSVTTEVAGCPWNAGHRLVRIGLKGREIEARKRPASNLVFLLDVSGSMTDANKLPLVREAMKLLVEQLTENDRVAIVVYAGTSGLVLPSTTGDKQREIREAIDRLEAGGSTNGAGGIQHAYEIAAQNFIKGGTNRVILATDGDFNVGITDREQLIQLITEQAKSGVFLTTLGFGMGNLKDGTLEQLADKGNGNYAYIDDLREAKKVFVEQMQGTLATIAKDVKIQIEFNPAEVASYRLIGYENRILAHEDFNDDKKDAGEIGAGHTVTALYEIAPTAGAATEEVRPAVDELKYQPKPAAAPVDAQPGELLTLKLRYKQPDGDTSKLIESVVKDNDQPYARASADFKFASSVALFGMLLRNSPHKGTGTIDGVIELGLEGLSKDDGGYRTEFVELAKLAKQLGAR